jgi:hypothetical protein
VECLPQIKKNDNYSASPRYSQRYSQFFLGGPLGMGLTLFSTPNLFLSA